MGSKGSFPLFTSWFKNFTATVFIQSFQAILLVFILIMLSQVQKQIVKIPVNNEQTNTSEQDQILQDAIDAEQGNLNSGSSGGSNTQNTGVIKSGRGDGVLAIIAIAGAMGIIKFEKLIKKWLGIDEGPIGNTASAGYKFFMGAKSALGLGKTAVSGFGADTSAGKAAKKAHGQLEKLKASYAVQYGDPDHALGVARGVISPSTPSPSASMAKMASDTYTEMKKASDSVQDMANTVKKEVSGATDTVKKGQKEQTKMTEANKGQEDRHINTHGRLQGKSQDSVYDIMNEDRRERKLEKMQELEDEEIKQRKLQATAKRDKYYNAAGTLASVAIGLGAADELSESLAIANVINQPIAYSSTKIAEMQGSNQLYKEATTDSTKSVSDNSKFLANSVGDAIKEGFKDYGKAAISANPIYLSMDVVNSGKYRRQAASQKEKIKVETNVNDIS